MKYAVTGPRAWPASEQAFVFETIAGLADVSEFTTGGAYGVDSLAAEGALLCHANAVHRLCIPADLPCNPEVVAYFREHGHKVSRVRGTYADRNATLIGCADVLLAFVPTRKEQERSGTWQTIREALRWRVQVRLLPLDEWVPA